MRQNAQRVGTQILVAAAATAAGFLAFVPTSFVGVAELGLIAGVGMLIAFICTMTFLPAAITLFRPPGEGAVVGLRLGGAAGSAGGAPRGPILMVAAALAVAGGRRLPAAAVRFRSARHQEPEHRGDARRCAT